MTLMVHEKHTNRTEIYAKYALIVQKTPPNAR